MSITRFWLRPLDTLYFGPPSSIPAGDAHRGHTMFPPPPMAFQGLVRTRLLTGADPPLDLGDRSEQGRQSIAGLIGDPDTLPKGWQIEGPWPSCLVMDADEVVAEPWVPSPRFLFQAAEESSPEPARAFELLHCPDARSRSPEGNGNEPETSHPGLNDLLQSGVEPDGRPYLLGLPQCREPRPIGGWLSAANLVWALTGEGSWDANGHCSEHPWFVRLERRAGVAIDPSTGRARDQHLYFLDVLRFAENTGFAGWLEADLDPPLRAGALRCGVGRAGRGGRLVAFEPLPSFAPGWNRLWRGDHLTAEGLDGSRYGDRIYVWLVLMSPVRIKDPQHPELDWSSVPEVGIRVRGALIGPPLVLGGFRMAGDTGRPNRAYIPAGSCWLIELQGGSIAEQLYAVRRLHASHVLGPREEARFGFGLTLVGLAPALGRI